MKQLSVLAVIAVSLTLGLQAQVALGNQPGVTTSVETRFQAADPPAEADLMQVVLDFAPGAWTPVHTHGAPVYVTVLSGEMTLRMSGMDQKFTAGQTWIDNPDEPHAAGNDGSAPARLVGTWVLPKGATPTTIVETGAQAVLPPGPTTVAQYRVGASGLPTPLDVVHRLVEVAPGASLPPHTHPGPNLVSVLEGDVTLQMSGLLYSYQAGNSWAEPANTIHSGAAHGSATARVVATALIPRGAPVGAPAQP
jgi:quercetin dioxygenase-like cupin family protein